MIFFTKVFYDINTYKKVLKWGVIKTCTYFFILCTILTVSLLITVYTPIKTNYVECIENVKDALSKIKIIDGKVVPLKEGSIQIKDKSIVLPQYLYYILSSEPLQHYVVGASFALYLPLQSITADVQCATACI